MLPKHPCGVITNRAAPAAAFAADAAAPAAAASDSAEPTTTRTTKTTTQHLPDVLTPSVRTLLHSYGTYVCSFDISTQAG